MALIVQCWGDPQFCPSLSGSPRSWARTLRSMLCPDWGWVLHRVWAAYEEVPRAWAVLLAHENHRAEQGCAQLPNWLISVISTGIVTPGVPNETILLVVCILSILSEVKFNLLLLCVLCYIPSLYSHHIYFLNTPCIPFCTGYSAVPKISKTHFLFVCLCVLGLFSFSVLCLWSCGQYWE